MRLFGLFFFTIFSQIIYGQDWNCSYPAFTRHSTSLKTFKGDSVNQQNHLGEYIGKHIYTDTNSLAEIKSYIIGEFQNGLPYGKWEERCADGSYSYGSVKANYYVAGTKIVEVKNVISNKIGTWKYYDSTGNLSKTLHYEIPNRRNGWTQKISRIDSNGKSSVFFHRGRLDYMFGLLYRSFSYKYFNNGKIKYHHIYSSFRTFDKEYYSNGNLKSYYKVKRFFWTKPKWQIKKTYNEQGQLIERKKSEIACCTDRLE